MHFGEERQIRRHLGIHMLGGLRHKEVGRRIVGVADLVALRAGSLVGPDEVVRLMQRQRVAVISGSRRVDARQMVSVEDHGDRLAELVEFGKEIGGRIIRQRSALLIGFDGLLLVVLQRFVRGGGRLEIVMLVPLVVRHVVLHGDDLQELVGLGFLHLFQRALVGGLVGDVRRVVELVLVRDDVRTGQRIEMREAELLVVGGARIHGRFVRVQADGVLCGAPHLVDCRRPMLARHQLLVWAGQGGIEIRHAQAGQSHVFQVGGAAAVSGGQHQAGRGILLDLTDLRHGILVDFESRHA